MAGVKLIVQYPRPKDIDAFEKVYQNEHVPMAVAKLAGKTRIVANKVVASPQGVPAFYRIAEIHFPSMQALQACAESAGQADNCQCLVFTNVLLAPEEVSCVDVYAGKGTTLDNLLAKIRALTGQRA